tara:strand:+ start:72 stop:221 length:150 start_codon:yes stop_codon:yes gene_type:complete
MKNNQDVIRYLVNEFNKNEFLNPYHQSISDCLNELEINFKDFCARSSVG